MPVAALVNVSRRSDALRPRLRLVRLVLVVMLLIFIASSCSNSTPTGVAIDDAGTIRIYFGSCRDQDRIGSIRVWDNDHYGGQPIWVAKAKADENASRSIIVSDEVPGYEIAGTVSAIYSNRTRPYTYEGLGTKQNNLMGGRFHPNDLQTGQILFDSGRSEALEKWQSHHSCGAKS